jgi:hypothetical protein
VAHTAGDANKLVMPDGLIAKFMTPRREILPGAFCYRGSLNGVCRRRFREMRDVRRAHGLSLFDVRATGWLPGHNFAGRRPSDNPNLTFCQRNLAAIHSAGGVVTLVKNQPAMSLRYPNLYRSIATACKTNS